MITITTYRAVPARARGQVRDVRVRWALEEAGLSYSTRLLEPGENRGSLYRARQPFGQVPLLEEDDLVLFESGAIVLYIAERSEALLPKDPKARARATAWVIAALNSVEPFLTNVAAIDLFFADESWAKQRRPDALQQLEQRLAAVSESLGSKSYLDGEQFTAGDLMMASVLRILDYSDIARRNPRLTAYLERCLGRPAFQRALTSHLTDVRAMA